MNSLNERLTIKKLNGTDKFEYKIGGKNIGYTKPKGFALYIEGLGYVAFDINNPYTLRKKAMEEILKMGFMNYDNIVFINPIS